MSKINKNKNSKQAPKEIIQEAPVEEIPVETVPVTPCENGSCECCDKVEMIFSEDKFYNDLTNPMFVKGKVYVVEGKDWIQRWVKRGGAIVDKNTGKPVIADGDNKQKVEETKMEESKEVIENL